MKLQYLLFIVCLLSCRKKDIEQPVNPTPDLEPKTERNIYITGVTDFVPTYWKNGIANELSHSTSSGGALKILVHQSNVYVLGFEQQASTTTSPVLWKNGVKTQLSDQNITINPSGMVMHQEDLYITGTMWLNSYTPRALVWKNGALINYLDKFENCRVSSIASDGQHLYMGGAENVNGNTKMLVWKDGKSIYLNGTPTDGNIYDVVVRNNDFYACGYEPQGPSYWKNFERVPLDTSGKMYLFNLVPSKIRVTDKNDVYVLSMENNNTPVYWKNGNLYKAIDRTKRHIFHSFEVNNDTLFTVGASLINFYSPAFYWKNEDVFPLPQSTGKMPEQYNSGYATDILIMEENKK